MKLLTLQQVAEQLHKHPRTISRYMDSGLIAFIRVGRDRLVSDDDMIRFLQMNREPSADEKTERARATISVLPVDEAERLERLADEEGL